MLDFLDSVYRRHARYKLLDLDKKLPVLFLALDRLFF